MNTQPYPFKITTGQTIGIMSPSSSVVPERFDAGCTMLRDRGFRLVIHPQTYTGADTGNQQAGTPTEKASAFMDLWTNPEIDAIMAACGGNFSAQFLHHLDINALKKSPAKPVIGFSDTTALLTALYTQTGYGGIFGPTVQNLTRIAHHNTVFDILSGRPDTTIDLTDAIILTEGTTQPAPVFAATLSVLLSLAGTRHFPNLTGHIVILEDVGEELSHLDRMLWQLDQLIPFDTLAGLIFGEFVDIKDTGRPFGLDFTGILKKFTTGRNLPVVINAPIGHGANFLPIPLGRTAVLTATNNPASQSLILI